MAQETMKAVQQAELEAERTEQEARKKAEEILTHAKEQADKIQSDAGIADAGAQDSAIKAAKQDAERLRGAALQDLESEIASLKKTAEQKKKEAIQMILQEVIG